MTRFSGMYKPFINHSSMTLMYLPIYLYTCLGVFLTQQWISNWNLGSGASALKRQPLKPVLVCLALSWASKIGWVQQFAMHFFWRRGISWWFHGDFMRFIGIYHGIPFGKGLHSYWMWPSRKSEFPQLKIGGCFMIFPHSYVRHYQRVNRKCSRFTTIHHY